MLIFMGIEEFRNDMVKTMCELVSIKSISPVSGGEGEGKRADFIENMLKSWDLSPKRFDYTDEAGAKRSNLAVKYGNKERTIWILAHIDTVSEGDIAAWSTDPFNAVVKDGKIFGRGTQDNGEGTIAALYTLRYLMGKQIKYNVGVIFAADEEVGSKYGIQKLLKENIFGKSDMFIVPDWGSKKGNEIEIAEKSIMWLKVTVNGKQVHASTPKKGVNSLRNAAKFMIEVDKALHKKYKAKSNAFPSGSTFEMTKHEKNVDSTNIIPGKDVFYFDFRVIPDYSLDEIYNDILAISSKYKKVRIDLEKVQEEQAAPPTSTDSEIIRVLANSIKSELSMEPKFVGIGGGTVAAYLRKAGYSSAVWSIEEDIAHQPNEYVIIENLVNVAKVFASIFV